MKKIIVLLLFILSGSTFSQTYRDFAREIFFGHLPSAKTEAMGRILSLNFDPFFVSQSNPANLVQVNGVSIFYANSSPYYALDNASYNYAGFSYHHPVAGAFAFNFLKFNYGIPIIGEEAIGSDDPAIDLYTLTYSNEIKDWIVFGINANLFVYNLNKSYTSTFFDVGLSRDFKVVQNSQINDKITVGSQLKNIFNQSFSSIDEAQADVFPMIFQIGLSNTVQYTDTDVYEKDYFFGFTLGLEYQDLFNSDYRTAYKVGGEISLLDIIFMRGGYYHETTIDYGFNSTGQLEEFTYGAGLKLDFNSLFTDDFPLVINFDYVSLKQPTYITNYDDWDNFTTYSLIANYRLDSN